MSEISPVNSSIYWDGRFSDNWEACDGPQQSRFFTKLAIENLPSWLIEQIRRQSLTLADWGCAQGDGTDMWASYLPENLLTGIDFSAVAIEQASKRYPAIKFINENWLAPAPAKTNSFDIVFSSNTLEHFHKPYEALEALSSRADKAIILALPYCEFDRISEHFYTFLTNNIPITLSNGFHLIWSRVIDCSAIPGTQWPGYQIFLVYAENSWIESLKLTLEDCKIEQHDNASTFNHLNQAIAERDWQIANLDQTIIERNGQIASLNQVVAERDEQIANLNCRLRDEEQKVRNLLLSTSWRITGPLRFTKKLLQSVNSAEVRYRTLKSLYWRLPEWLRALLNKYRYRYVMKYRHILGSQSASIISVSNSQSHLSIDWINKLNKATKVILIACGFEFDELINQRPINAAKYFSNNGFVVLFIAWQWSPSEQLLKGMGEVYPNIIQVPLFDFIAHHETINLTEKVGYYILTMPVEQLVQTMSTWRQKGGCLIYDIMDDWHQFYRTGQAPWYEKALEEHLVLNADLVTVVSPALREKFLGIRSDIHIIGNGYSPEILGIEYQNVARREAGNKKIIGYFGHLTDAWFDWQLIFEIAVKMPDVIFELIGYGEPDWVREKIIEFKNIYLIGKVYPSNLHIYVARWSVGIIPFVESDLSHAVDPIKIYEYLYFGLPVVVTGITHLKDYPCTYVANRNNIFNFLDVAFEEAGELDHLSPFLKNTTWHARFERLSVLIQSHRTIGTLYK
ncbi:MAG: methyltransferase domain-containing protein [Nitrosomonas sp.]|nr:methyltransferase domain-containing protein [Nitrosomonas sp.]